MELSEIYHAVRSRLRPSVLVGVAGFLFGSLTLVRAGQLAVDHGHINAIADANNINQTVQVDPLGQLSTADQGTRTRLDGVNAALAGANQRLDRTPYDLMGNLKVAPQGTTEVAGAVSVSGSVTVSNLPSSQTVSGQVSVSNFPSTQPVSGSISVNNLPSVQNVNVTGGSTDLAPTDVSFGGGGYSLQNDGTSEGEYFAAAGGCASQVGSTPPDVLNSKKFVQIISPCNGAGITHVSLLSVNVGNGNLALVCMDRFRNQILHANIHGDTVREFVHPLAVSSCYLECFETNPDFGNIPPLPTCHGNFTIAGH